MEDKILNSLKNAEIDCPECKYMEGYDSYTFTTCWCQGGNEKLNVISYLKDNPSVLEELLR